MAAQNLALDSFWVDRSVYSAAEQSFYERLGHEQLTPLVAEFVKARETIKEMKRQANEAAEVVGDGLHVKEIKETKNDGAGKQSKKQKQKAAARDQQAKNAKSADKRAETPKSPQVTSESLNKCKTPNEPVETPETEITTSGPSQAPEKVETPKSPQVTSASLDNKCKTPNEPVETPETEITTSVPSQASEKVETPKSPQLPTETAENACKTPSKSVETPESKNTPSTPPHTTEKVETPKSPKAPTDTTENECKTPTKSLETLESKNTPSPPPQTPEKVEAYPQPETKKEKEKRQEKSVSPPKKDKTEAKTAQTNVGGNITAMDCEPVKFLEKKMLAFTDMMAKVQSQLEAMDARLSSIEQRVGGGAPAVAVCPAKPSPACAKPAAKPADDDDDVDLFGSESEDDEAAAKIKEERLAAYNAKKSKKPALVAKSSIILDVKPWDDETDMKLMEEVVRKIACDGLLWGASKLVPLAYGIKKLQINCVVEDEKVSIDWLQEQIEANEDYVQSVDIAAFNKI